MAACRENFFSMLIFSQHMCGLFACLINSLYVFVGLSYSGESGKCAAETE